MGGRSRHDFMVKLGDKIKSGKQFIVLFNIYGLLSCQIHESTFNIKRTPMAISARNQLNTTVKHIQSGAVNDVIKLSRGFACYCLN